MTMSMGRMIFLAGGILASQVRAEDVEYRLDLTVAPAHHLGYVEARFPGGGSALEVKMPAWRTGKYQILNLANGVRELRAVDASGKPLVVAKTDKDSWRIENPGAGPVTVRYEIYANMLAQRVRHIDDTHAFLDASGIFVYEESRRGLPVDVRLTVPEGWDSRSGLVSDGPNHFRAPNYDVLVDSPIETGLHHTDHFAVDGKTHELVFWGEGNYQFAPIKADMARFIAAAGELWGGYPFDRYVWMVHAGTDIGGATEHLNSTIISRDRWGFSPREDYLKFIRTAAHEFVHTWNVKAYRPAGLVPYRYTEENYSPLLWVAEGTTSYFESLLVYRSGVVNNKEFCKELAGLIDRHQNRPGRHVQSIADASFDEWIDEGGDRGNNASVDIYDQGELTSLVLDLEIRARTHGEKGLEDVHRRLYQRYPAERKGYTEADFLALLNEVAGSDFGDFWARYVRGTEELPLARVLGEAGLEIRHEADKDEMADGDAGFTGVKTAVKDGMLLFSQVQRDSPAWKAGLDAGDQLLALDGYRVSPEKADKRLKSLKPGETLTVAVFRNDRLLDFTFSPRAMPRGKLTVAPVAKPTRAQKARFEAWTGVAWPKTDK